MALVRTGSLLLKAFKPNTQTPIFIQVRNAARKGYREKSKQKRKLSKLESTAEKEKMKIRRKYTKVEKTVELSKPDPPKDDIILMDNFKHIKYSISDAVKFHRECHHPTIFNNPDAPVNVRIELNMTGKKITQVLKPFTGIVGIPHPITSKQKKEVLVLCDPEHAESAVKSGATIVGGLDLVKKIQGGVIHPMLYEYVICHVNFLPQLAPIRGLLKDQMPKINKGTLTGNLGAAVQKFLHGIEYTCVKFGEKNNFGIIECPVGSIDMELGHIEENLKALIEDVFTHRASTEREFITWIWCMSPPSPERFALDLSLYLPKEEPKEEEDEDEEEIRGDKLEKMKLKELKKQLEEEAEQLEQKA